MKILISYWYEINTYHVLPTNGKNSWFPDWFSMSTSPGTQKCKPHQPQSLGGLSNHRITSQMRVSKYKDWKLWKSVKFSPALDVCSHGPGMSRQQSCRPVLSLQLPTLKLQCVTCCIRSCQAHSSVTSGPQNLLSAPCPSQPTQQRCPANSCSPPLPWAQQAHTTKTLKCRWSTNTPCWYVMLHHVTDQETSPDHLGHHLN